MRGRGAVLKMSLVAVGCGLFLRGALGQLPPVGVKALTPAFALRGHEQMVTGVAFSPDGKVLATSSMDQTVRLWDTGTGQELANLGDAKFKVGAVMFSGDGRLVGAAGGGKLWLWDVATHKLKTTVVVSGAGPYDKWALSADGATAAWNQGGDIGFYDVASGAKRCVGKLKDNAVALAFSADGKMLACGRGLNGGGEQIVVLDPATGKELFSIHDLDDRQVQAVAFSPDGKTLASSGKWVKMWDVATKAEKTPAHKTADYANGTAQRMSFTADGKTLVHDQEGVTFVDVATGKAGTRIKGSVFDMLMGPRTVSADGKLCAANVGTRFVKIWRIGEVSGQDWSLTAAGGVPSSPIGARKTAEGHLVIEGHEASVRALAFGADSKTIFSSSDDGTVRAWDATDGKQGFSVRTTFTAARLAVSKDGKTLVAGQSVELIVAGTGKVTGKLDAVNVSEFSVAADTGQVAVTCDGDIKIFDVGSGKAVKSLAVTRRPHHVLMTPDGQRVLWQSYGQPVMVVEVGTGKTVGQIATTDLRGWSMSPDGKLVVLGETQSLRLVEVATQKEVATAKVFAARGMAFSPNGKMLACNQGGESPVLILEVSSLKEIGQWREVTDFSSVAFSPDGKVLAISNLDRIRVIPVADLAGQH